ADGNHKGKDQELEAGHAGATVLFADQIRQVDGACNNLPQHHKAEQAHEYANDVPAHKTQCGHLNLLSIFLLLACKPSGIALPSQINRLASSQDRRPTGRNLRESTRIGVVDDLGEIVDSRTQSEDQKLHALRTEVLILADWPAGNLASKKTRGFDPSRQ